MLSCGERFFGERSYSLPSTLQERQGSADGIQTRRLRLRPHPGRRMPLSPGWPSPPRLALSLAVSLPRLQCEAEGGRSRAEAAPVEGRDRRPLSHLRAPARGRERAFPRPAHASSADGVRVRAPLCRLNSSAPPSRAVLLPPPVNLQLTLRCADRRPATGPSAFLALCSLLTRSLWY